MRILAVLVFSIFAPTDLYAGDIGHGDPTGNTTNSTEDQSWWEELLSSEDGDG